MPSRGQSGVGHAGAFHFVADRHLDKSSTTFDIRQRLTSGVVYELPFFRDRNTMLGRAADCWQTNFIFTAQTGNLTTVGDGTRMLDSWSRFDRPVGLEFVRVAAR